MNPILLSGNEAIALGAYEAGATCGFGYPGTPSTEILESFVRYTKSGDCLCEWAPNEKVALENAVGASLAGARAFVAMKHVGLNVAADPLMTLSYIGTVGGLVICVADDPGQHSSQTEQDTRHYARLAKVPILEPGNAAEARDFMREAFVLSEKYQCPVILRSTTCVSHSRSFVTPGQRIAPRTVGFRKDPTRFVPLPIWGRVLRRNIETRLDDQSQDNALHPFLNRTYHASAHAPFAILSHGVTAFHCLEQFQGVPLLKIGWSFPFPDALIRAFARTTDRLVVIEEGDPILEEHIKSLGISCDGKNLVPRCGEITPSEIFRIKARLEQSNVELPLPVPASKDLPPRTPSLCPGCPHRALFYALTKFDVVVSGDIGCYSFGAFPPLNRTDTLLCMGGGFTVAHGMKKAGELRPVIGILGDSTFFHSGITGLLNAVYNNADVKLIVLDNRITAMTGHQDHPGTGITLMGQGTHAASIEAFAQACGIENVVVCSPFDLKEMQHAIQEELLKPGPSLILSKAPCPLHPRLRKQPRKIDPDRCRNCRLCVGCGCPAIEAGNDSEKPRINESICNGCLLCEKICPFGAVSQL